VFQAGGLIVVLVEVGRKAYLASIVPVIVNAILNEHQIVVDIVAFVNRGDFPRSRLGEKQRGKILASWVTRKMRTMAQFGIRDADSAMSDITETMEPRSGIASLRNGNGSVTASSLRNAEVAPQIIEEREMERQQVQAQNSFAPLPTGISEMPAQNYNESHLGSTTGNGRASTKSDDTPTDTRKTHFELPSDDFDPEKNNFLDGVGEEFTVPGFMSSTPEPPRVGPKPTSAGNRDSLPAVDGRDGDLWSLPSQQRQGGGLRVQNAADEDEDDTWKNEAIMHMNLAGR
jgi:hypothetical protein